MTPQEALTRTIEHREIFHDEMLDLMRSVMDGELSPLMVAAILIGLRVKKETIGEIAAAAQVMRERAMQVVVKDDEHLVDIAGTGGDGANTFNISSAAMFAAAAAGVKIAKHGGRAVSSSSGSADVLEALGVRIEQEPDHVAASIEAIGIGFMYAPHYLSVMKNVQPIRRELGVRTVFNILGPLVNPANAPQQVMGVFHPDLVGIQARTMQRLGRRRALTLFGREGLDEISVSGPTLVGELREGRISEYEIHPEMFNLPLHDPKLFKVNSTDESKQLVLAALENRNIPARNLVALNAGAMVYVSGVADSLAAGTEQALEALISGAARAKLDDLIRFSSR